MNDLTVTWLDRSAIGRPQSHDERHSYNPPALEAPAMDQSQFEYDNQRQIEDAIMLNPSMLAFVLRDLKDRVAALEKEIGHDNGS